MLSKWTDAGGVSHEAADVSRRRRVISLVPSLTETLCALGGREKLVGCTAFCIRPGDLLHDPAVAKVGGTKTILREKILALQPDLALVNLEENELDDIAWLRSICECYVNGCKTLADGIRSIREIGALIGADARAGELAGRADEILNSIRKETAAITQRPRIFYAIWRNPWMTISADTFIHDHLTQCGALNAVAIPSERRLPAGSRQATTRYPEVSLDQLRTLAPDVVWLPSEPYRFEEKHVEELKNFGGFPAADNNRIELVDGDNVCWFGVRQLEGMAYTFRKLWPKGT